MYLFSFVWWCVRGYVVIDFKKISRIVEMNVMINVFIKELFKFVCF